MVHACHPRSNLISLCSMSTPGYEEEIDPTIPQATVNSYLVSSGNCVLFFCGQYHINAAIMTYWRKFDNFHIY